MRAIDADAFRREIDNHWPFTKEEQSKHGIADMAKGTLLHVLNCMPTIEPERKKGKWITSSVRESMLWECDQCGYDCGAHSFNFCPNCGADMNGGDQDE